MPRSVLVPANGTNTDAPAFAAAVAVGRAWSGHLKFLHVRANVDSFIMSVAGAGMMATGSAIVDITSRLEQEIAEQQQRAEREVRDFCAREDITFDGTPGANRTSAEWQVETGDEGTWLAAHGRVADLVVVGRARDGETVAMNLLEAALIQTGRPMLIPATKPLQVAAGIVAIAWKDTREAARAVAAALPFVAKAARVVILSLEENGKGSDQSCDRLSQALRWHNPEVALQRLVPDGRAPVETLLDAAATFRANLLVMGGYGRRRTSELLFGGFTRRVLRDAELPVLMAR